MFCTHTRRRVDPNTITRGITHLHRGFLCERNCSFYMSLPDIKEDFLYDATGVCISNKHATITTKYTLSDSRLPAQRFSCCTSYLRRYCIAPYSRLRMILRNHEAYCNGSVREQAPKKVFHYICRLLSLNLYACK